MAVSVSAINAITKQLFIPKLVDNVMQSNGFLYFLEKNKGFENIDGGQDIRQPVRYARFSSRGFYSGAETQSTAYNEKKTALVFDWKQYFVNITISGLDKIKNMGENRVIDHVRSEVEAAEEDIRDSFGTGVYSNGYDRSEIDRRCSRLFVRECYLWWYFSVYRILAAIERRLYDHDS
jgi:hypothetical protein